MSTQHAQHAPLPSDGYPTDGADNITFYDDTSIVDDDSFDDSGDYSDYPTRVKQRPQSHKLRHRRLSGKKHQPRW